MPVISMLPPRAPDSIAAGRILLRRPRPVDAEAIFARYSSDAAVTRLVGWPRHTSVEQARGFIRFSDGEWARSPSGPMLIEARDTGALLGGTGLAFETPYYAQTGYALATGAWGQGYATDALSAIVSLARTLAVRCLDARCHHDHRASAHVLENARFPSSGAARVRRVPESRARRSAGRALLRHHPVTRDSRRVGRVEQRIPFGRLQ